MTPGRAQRLQLYEELVKEFGDEPAMTLMESLPPVDWHELATKDDLAGLEERVNARFEVVDARFDALRVELGARIDTGLAELRGEMSAMNARFEVVDARFDAVGDRIDKGLADLRGEMRARYGSPDPRHRPPDLRDPGRAWRRSSPRSTSRLFTGAAG